MVSGDIQDMVCDVSRWLDERYSRPYQHNWSNTDLLTSTTVLTTRPARTLQTMQKQTKCPMWNRVLRAFSSPQSLKS